MKITTVPEGAEGGWMQEESRSAFQTELLADVPSTIDESSPNRSLQRGLSILRCFRPGLGVLGNADIVDRTGLPKATVSRLTKTLVNNGFLRRVPGSNAFRLSYSVLSLAHAVMLDSQVAHEALPLMQDLGNGKPINVGLSVRDELDMVYLHVVYGDLSRQARRIEPGHRKPLEFNAVGRAYLATLDEAERATLLRRCQERHPAHWERVAQELEVALALFQKEGYCYVIWGYGTESLAMPLRLDEGIFVLNVSFNVNDFTHEQAVQQFLPAMKTLSAELCKRLAARALASSAP